MTSLHDAAPLYSARAVESVRAGGRLVVFSELFPPAVGGSAVLLHGIYSRITDAEIVVLTDPSFAPGRGGHESVEVVSHSMPTWRSGLKDWRGLKYHVRSAMHLRALTSGRTSIVHCARAIPEGIGALLARLSGGPRYVCWAHGEDLASALTSRELTLTTRAVLACADAALANSHNTAALLRVFGVPDSKIHIVYPAVDANRFRPDVDGEAVRGRFANGDDILLLSVGRLQRRKGHDTAIRAVAALSETCPTLRYVIAGDGEERPRLEALALKYGVSDRVVFAGVVPEEHLPAYYAACDIFLLPNRIDNGDIEGFGIVFLEAAASGKPVIGGDSGGVPEAVGDRTTGLLTEGGSVESVAAAIHDLASSPSRRHALGTAARTRVQKLFSWQHAAARVSELQSQLIARA
jgi:phosphatidylinositol alpha-1,6-mannosyltransferase